MLSKRINIGAMCPKFYGFSYQDYASDYLIYHPFPFNYLIGWLRPKWVRIRYGKVKWETAIEKEYNKKFQEKRQMFYKQGKKSGYKEGYDQGFHEGVQKNNAYWNNRLGKVTSDES